VTELSEVAFRKRETSSSRAAGRRDFFLLDGSENGTKAIFYFLMLWENMVPGIREPKGGRVWGAVYSTVEFDLWSVLTAHCSVVASGIG